MKIGLLTTNFGIALGCLALALLPLLQPGETILQFATLTMIWAIAAISFDLVFGVAGMLSFGHAAFLGVGAYTYAILTLHGLAPTVVALILAGLAGGATAILFALISLRLAGIYLGIMTMALAQVVYILATGPLRPLTGGDDGLPGVPRLQAFGLAVDRPADSFLLVLGIFAAVVMINACLRASPFGQVLSALRQNETRVAHLGFSVVRHKALCFAVSGFFSGIAGSLLASQLGIVTPQTLHWVVSGDILIMTLLGGAGTLFGPIVGALMFELLRETLSGYTEHWYGLLGLTFMLCTIYLPNGVVGSLRRGLRHV